MNWLNFFLSIIFMGLEIHILTLAKSSFQMWFLLLVYHALCTFFSFRFFQGETSRSVTFKETFSSEFTKTLLLIGIIPVSGSVGLLTTGLIFKFYPVDPLPIEEFELLDQSYMETYAKGLKEYSFFNINPGSIIHNEISFEEASWNLQTLDHLEWFPYKTKFLQLFLEYSQHPSIIVEASRIINHKKDTIIKKIRQLDGEKDYFSLAELNHEIYHLCLVCPPLDKFYLDKACTFILEALKKNDADTEIYHYAIKYHLQNNMVEIAEKLLDEGNKKFHNNSRFQLISDIFGQEIQFKKDWKFS